MLVETMVSAAMAEFKQILESLGETVDTTKLTPQVAEEMSAGLQNALSGAGVAAFRAFLLAFEVQEDVVRDAEGEVYRFKAARNAKFMTPWGKMTLTRRCYQNKSDTRSYAPLDAAWGMEGRYLTPQVREAVLFACAHVTPQEAAQLLEKCALFKPDQTTIKREVKFTGELIKTNQRALDEAVRAEDNIPEQTRVMVVSADGATVLMNEEGVPFGRPAERPGNEKPDETPTAYRVAMVGSFSCYGAPQTPGETPKRLQSRYVAHMPERGCPTFKTFLEAELDHFEAHAPEQAARVLLLDGARELWSYFDKNPRYDHYHRCLDFWHAAEHLSVSAEALFGSGETAKRWYEKYYRNLLESDDGARQICRSIDYHRHRHSRNKTSEKHLQEQYTYFKRNGKLMRYATFQTNGWPIGSGPIEAACKMLIKTRMCRSGMRWTRPGGQNILSMRTYIKSSRWDSAWHQIKQMKTAA